MNNDHKLYGQLTTEELVEEDGHPYEQGDLVGGEMDGEYYTEYVWEGEHEEMVDGGSVGHVIIQGQQQQQAEDYGEDDFNEYVQFNNEEEAKSYMAVRGHDMIAEDEEDLIEDTGEEVAEEVMHQEELHDPSHNSLFQMYQPHARRQATVVECEICGLVLKHPSKIRAHMRTHTGERPFVCTVCGRGFTQRTPWRMHEKRHNQDLPFPCSHGCGKAFPNGAQRNAHELRHVGRKRLGPPRPHLKPKLRQLIPPDALIEAQEALMDDMRGPPVIEAPLFTEPIPMSAAAHRRLDEVINAVAENRPLVHMNIVQRNQVESVGEGDRRDGRSIHPPKNKRAPPIVAQCQICGLMVKHPSKIQAHMRSHNGVKPWECSICGLRVGTMYALKNHLKRKHSQGERPLACTWECGRRFVSVSARNEHERIVHAGIRRYECSIGGCRRLFARRSHIVAHRLRDHPGLIHVDEFDEDIDMRYMEGEGMNELDDENKYSMMDHHEDEHVDDYGEDNVDEPSMNGDEHTQTEHDDNGDELYSSLSDDMMIKHDIVQDDEEDDDLSSTTATSIHTVDHNQLIESIDNDEPSSTVAHQRPRMMKLPAIVRPRNLDTNY